MKTPFKRPRLILGTKLFYVFLIPNKWKIKIHQFVQMFLACNLYDASNSFVKISKAASYPDSRITFFSGFVVCFCFFSCKFGQKLPKMCWASNKQKMKRQTSLETLGFSQENSKNCHVPATCPLLFSLSTASDDWESYIQSSLKCVCVNECVCVSRSHPRILARCY